MAEGSEEELVEILALQEAANPLRHARIKRIFGDLVLCGQVEYIDMGLESGEKLYRIRYENGDQEHMTAHGVREVLVEEPPIARELVRELFAKLDANGDGFLSEQEMRPYVDHTGFQGSDAAWTSEFRSLCEQTEASHSSSSGSGSGSSAGQTRPSWIRQGLDRASFARLLSRVDDHALRQVLQVLKVAATLEDSRPVAIREVFKRLDANGDGVLCEQEMRPYANHTGFDGSDAEWVREFQMLCSYSGIQHIDEECFVRLVDDQSDNGIYCTDQELRELLSTLPAPPRVTVIPEEVVPPESAVEAPILPRAPPPSPSPSHSPSPVAPRGEAEETAAALQETSAIPLRSASAAEEAAATATATTTTATTTATTTTAAASAWAPVFHTQAQPAGSSSPAPPPEAEVEAQDEDARDADVNPGWALRDARRALLRFLSGLSLQNMNETAECPGGFAWPEGQTIPDWFPSVPAQLHMYAAPLFDDARASAAQTFSQTNPAVAWRVLLQPLRWDGKGRDEMAKELPEGRDTACSYHRVLSDPAVIESRPVRRSWLPFSVVLLVRQPIPLRREDFLHAEHCFGVLLGTRSGYVVQTLGMGRSSRCALCLVGHRPGDLHGTAACPCGHTLLHGRCVAQQRSSVRCERCGEPVNFDPSSLHPADEHAHPGWAMLVLDSFVSPYRQAGVLQQYLEHYPPFWEEAISGNRYGVQPPGQRQQPSLRGGQQRPPRPVALRLEDSSWALGQAGLNDSQRQACEQALGLLQGVVLIQGPPGTGKTKTIVALLDACAVCGERVLTCGPTNVAVCEIAKRARELVESGAAASHLRLSQLCMVAAEERAGITMDHPLSSLMLDHRKKRVKRVAKAGSNELVPLLSQLFSGGEARAVFRQWRRAAASGAEAFSPGSDGSTAWAPLTRLVQTKTTARELLQRSQAVPGPTEVPPDTEQACGDFVVQALEAEMATSVAVESILEWQLAHLYGAVPQLSGSSTSEGPGKLARVLETVWTLFPAMSRLLQSVKSIKSQMCAAVGAGGSALSFPDGADEPVWEASQVQPLQRALVDFRDACFQVQTLNSEDLRALILRGSVLVFSTITVAGRPMISRMGIGTVIVDEACQSRELETMIVMRSHIQRLVLVGDPRQLPSTVFSVKAKTMRFDRSLFERLVGIGQEKHMLLRQYRMLPEIAEFPNVAFYNGAVVNDETVAERARNVEEWIQTPRNSWNFHSAVRLFDTSGLPGAREVFDKETKACSNPFEADVVIRLLQSFFKSNTAGQRLSVGIITPYKGQVRLIEDRLAGESSTVNSRRLQRKIQLVKTVDGFQGNEQDIIVISTCRSNPNGNIGFVADERRLNVAITRPRLRLWVVGDMQTLARGDSKSASQLVHLELATATSDVCRCNGQCLWGEFVDFCQLRGWVQPVPDERGPVERGLDQELTSLASGGGSTSCGTHSSSGPSAALVQAAAAARSLGPSERQPAGRSSGGSSGAAAGRSHAVHGPVAGQASSSSGASGKAAASSAAPTAPGAAAQASVASPSPRPVPVMPRGLGFGQRHEFVSLAPAAEADALWSRHFLGHLVSTISSLRKESREKVVKKISQLLRGDAKIWNPLPRDAQGLPLWQLAVETTSVTNKQYLLWWVELDRQGNQQFVLANLVDGDQLAHARTRAAGFLHTFSDDYLRASMHRIVQDGKIRPANFDMDFEQFREADGQKVKESENAAQAQGLLPVSLEKRYKLTQRELDFLVEQSLQGVQLPYHLDEDEEKALQKIFHEVVFLLGRSGSGKTSVLVHGLFRAWCIERKRQAELAIQSDAGEAGEGDGAEDEEAVLVLLVTRSSMLADSIRKLFAQMQAGPSGSGVGGSSSSGGLGLSAVSGIELGVVRQEEMKAFRPPPDSFEIGVFNPEASPLIASWDAVLLMLDRSVCGECFFRPPATSESRVQQALQRVRGRMQNDRQNVELDVEDRFENLTAQTGLYEMEVDLLSYEDFEARFGPKLIGNPSCPLDRSRGDSLFVAYREIITVIAGSARAARSEPGCLSKEEYVGGRGPDGMPLPELRDSAHRESESCRVRMYAAWEIYRKLKQEMHVYDRTDAARHILRRAEFNGCKALRYLTGVFVDEVQDLLPIELLLLKLLCPRLDGFVFAGDTAQTISKGVEFRFESIRRLYFEEFILGGVRPKSKTAEVSFEKCYICKIDITQGGGTYLLCAGKYHEFFICGPVCYEKLEQQCKNRGRGATKGDKSKMEFAAGFRKLPCPRCCLALQEEPLVLPQSCASPSGSSSMAFPASPKSPARGSSSSTALTDVPEITFLTHNHRSTQSILEMAGSVLDVIMELFPDKVDKLPREISRVASSSPPVVLSRMTLDEAMDILFGASGASGSREKGTTTTTTSVKREEGNREEAVEDGAARGQPAAQEATRKADVGKRVLEFGAKQAVLVWSESKKAQMQDRFKQSIVMTIQECKGLEFFDVLLIDPFSDMAAAVKSGHATELWNLIYGFMQRKDMQVSAVARKRVQDFDPDRHGLLCAWLKTLYVAVTRARKRVWLLETHPEHGAAVIAYWQALGAAHVVGPGEGDVSGLAAGFAETSTGQEWLEEGQRQFHAGQNFEQACLCFKNAESAGCRQGTPWKLLAEAKQQQKLAKLRPAEGQARIREEANREAGHAFVRLAEWMEAALEPISPTAAAKSAKQVADELLVENLDFGTARQQAAECFLEGAALPEAAREFEVAGCFSLAAECLEALPDPDWASAGRLWRAAGQAERSLRAYVKAQAWEDFVDLAESLLGQGTEQERADFLTTAEDLVIMASRELAKSKAVKRALSSNSRSSQLECLKRCVGMLPAASQDCFLEGIGLPEVTLEVWASRERYDECAALCLERRLWQQARRYYKEAKKPSMVQRLELLEKLSGMLQGGGLFPSPGQLEQLLTGSEGPDLLRKEELQALRGVLDHKSSSKKAGLEQRCVVGCLVHLQIGIAAGPGTARRASLQAAWEVWASGPHSSSPGHALRLGGFALLAMSREFVLQGQDPLAASRDFQRLSSDFKACRSWLLELRGLGRVGPAASRGSQKEARQSAGSREALVGEWLLAEQPESVRPEFLVLTDCQPEKSESIRLSRDEMLRLAGNWSYLFEATLCRAWLEVCEAHVRRLVPCWQHLSGHGCHSQKGGQCSRWHGKQDPKLAGSAVRLLWEAAREAARVLQSSDLEQAKTRLGKRAVDALGGAKAWEAARALPQQSIGFLVARLKALTPESPTLALDTDLTDEELADLASEAASSLLEALRSKRRPPDLQEAVAVLSLSPFGRFGRPSGALDLRNQVVFDLLGMLDKTAENPVTMFAKSYLDSARPTGYASLQHLFVANCNVSSKIFSFWNDEKSRRTLFFPIKPAAVCFLLERVLVWASVIITGFDNTLLPMSFVKAHLAYTGDLAVYATQNQADRVRSDQQGKKVLSLIVEFVRSFLHWDLALKEWLDKHKAPLGETVLRLLTLAFAAGANHEEVRNKQLANSLNSLRPEKKLQLFENIRSETGASLPIGLQRLLLHLPEDQRVQNSTVNLMTPWAHAEFAKLGDPFVLLTRRDLHTRVPSWTLGSLRQHFQAPRTTLREQQAVEKTWQIPQDMKRRLLQDLRVQWPRVRCILAYDPGRTPCCDPAGQHVPQQAARGAVSKISAAGPVQSVAAAPSATSQAVVGDEEGEGEGDPGPNAEDAVALIETAAAATDREGQEGKDYVEIQAPAIDADFDFGGGAKDGGASRLSADVVGQAVESKVKKALLRRAVQAWGSQAREGRLEAGQPGPEEAETLQAEEWLQEMAQNLGNNLNAIQRIRYRSLVLPVARRQAEEKERLQKQLRQKLQETEALTLVPCDMSGAVVATGLAGKARLPETAMELSNRAQTKLDHLRKLGDDFLRLYRLDPTSVSPTSVCVQRSGMYWYSRKIEWLVLRDTLRRLALENFLIPAWILEQLQRLAESKRNRRAFASSGLHSEAAEASSAPGPSSVGGRAWRSSAAASANNNNNNSVRAAPQLRGPRRVWRQGLKLLSLGQVVAAAEAPKAQQATVQDAASLANQEEAAAMTSERTSPKVESTAGGLPEHRTDAAVVEVSGVIAPLGVSELQTGLHGQEEKHSQEESVTRQQQEQLQQERQGEQLQQVQQGEHEEHEQYEHDQHPQQPPLSKRKLRQQKAAEQRTRALHQPTDADASRLHIGHSGDHQAESRQEGSLGADEETALFETIESESQHSRESESWAQREERLKMADAQELPLDFVQLPSTGWTHMGGFGMVTRPLPPPLPGLEAGSPSCSSSQVRDSFAQQANEACIATGSPESTAQEHLSAAPGSWAASSKSAPFLVASEAEVASAGDVEVGAEECFVAVQVAIPESTNPSFVKTTGAPNDSVEERRKQEEWEAREHEESERRLQKAEKTAEKHREKRKVKLEEKETVAAPAAAQAPWGLNGELVDFLHDQYMQQEAAMQIPAQPQGTPPPKQEGKQQQKKPRPERQSEKTANQRAAAWRELEATLRRQALTLAAEALVATNPSYGSDPANPPRPEVMQVLPQRTAVLRDPWSLVREATNLVLTWWRHTREHWHLECKRFGSLTKIEGVIGDVCAVRDHGEIAHALLKCEELENSLNATVLMMSGLIQKSMPELPPVLPPPVAFAMSHVLALKASCAAIGAHGIAERLIMGLGKSSHDSDSEEADDEVFEQEERLLLIHYLTGVICVLQWHFEWWGMEAPQDDEAPQAKQSKKEAEKQPQKKPEKPPEKQPPAKQRAAIPQHTEKTAEQSAAAWREQEASLRHQALTLAAEALVVTDPLIGSDPATAPRPEVMQVLPVRPKTAGLRAPWGLVRAAMSSVLTWWRHTSQHWQNESTEIQSRLYGARTIRDNGILVRAILECQVILDEQLKVKAKGPPSSLTFIAHIVALQASCMARSVEWNAIQCERSRDSDSDSDSEAESAVVPSKALVVFELATLLGLLEESREVEGPSKSEGFAPGLFAETPATASRTSPEDEPLADDSDDSDDEPAPKAKAKAKAKVLSESVLSLDKKISGALPSETTASSAAPSAAAAVLPPAFPKGQGPNNLEQRLREVESRDSSELLRPQAVADASAAAEQLLLARCVFCQEQVAKSAMKKHKKRDCVERIVECERCEAQMPYRLLEEPGGSLPPEEHGITDCEKGLTSCELCGASCERGALALHQASTCPQAEGCCWRGPRSAAAAHESSCPFANVTCTWCLERVQQRHMPGHRCPSVHATDLCIVCAEDFASLLATGVPPALLLQGSIQACRHILCCASCASKCQEHGAPKCPACQHPFDAVAAAPIHLLSNRTRIVSQNDGATSSSTAMPDLASTSTAPPAMLGLSHPAPPPPMPPRAKMLPGTSWFVSPLQIHFTQQSVSPVFRPFWKDGALRADLSILHSARELLLGMDTEVPRPLEILDVVWHPVPKTQDSDDQVGELLFVAGSFNRRLCMHRLLAIFAPARFGLVKVQVKDREALGQAYWDSKFTTRCYGNYVEVRAGPGRYVGCQASEVQWPEACQVFSLQPPFLQGVSGKIGSEVCSMIASNPVLPPPSSRPNANSEVEPQLWHPKPAPPSLPKAHAEAEPPQLRPPMQQQDRQPAPPASASSNAGIANPVEWSDTESASVRLFAERYAIPVQVVVAELGDLCARDRVKVMRRFRLPGGYSAVPTFQAYVRSCKSNGVRAYHWTDDYQTEEEWHRAKAAASEPKVKASEPKPPPPPQPVFKEPLKAPPLKAPFPVQPHAVDDPWAPEPPVGFKLPPPPQPVFEGPALKAPPLKAPPSAQPAFKEPPARPQPAFKEPCFKQPAPTWQELTATMPPQSAATQPLRPPPPPPKPVPTKKAPGPPPPSLLTAMQDCASGTHFETTGSPSRESFGTSSSWALDVSVVSKAAPAPPERELATVPPSPPRMKAPPKTAGPQVPKVVVQRWASSGTDPHWDPDEFQPPPPPPLPDLDTARPSPLRMKAPPKLQSPPPPSLPDLDTAPSLPPKMKAPPKLQSPPPSSPPDLDTAQSLPPKMKAPPKLQSPPPPQQPDLATAPPSPPKMKAPPKTADPQVPKVVDEFQPPRLPPPPPPRPVLQPPGLPPPPPPRPAQSFVDSDDKDRTRSTDLLRAETWAGLGLG
ncbi:unnamed protein product [Polarella glacialis]|uniref:Calmodulin n=1 Tax=Polarella glacialis TaxID=89957 RepID=A0A813GMF2_POLGL|nr:unnamed protein product [Polarella glacialis]